MKRFVLFLSVFLFNPIFCVDKEEDRTPMHNFISGDAFRSIADWKYEEKYTQFWHKPTPSRYFLAQEIEIIENIEPGDIVFVQTHLMEYFIKYIHPKIKCPYFLITHKSDKPVDESYLEYINDPKLITWYAQNVNIVHDKVVSIPIGMPIKFWYKYRTRDLNLVKKVLRAKIRRKKKVYLNISVATCEKERSWVRNYFNYKEFIYSVGRRSYSRYLRDLKSCAFCLSPSGNGIDCWRTWEALLLGSIPIICPYEKYTNRLSVGHNSMYEDLPVIIVDKWTQVTSEFLEEKLNEMKVKKYNSRKLYFPYWKDLVLGSRKAFLEEYLESTGSVDRCIIEDPIE